MYTHYIHATIIIIGRHVYIIRSASVAFFPFIISFSIVCVYTYICTIVKSTYELLGCCVYINITYKSRTQHIRNTLHISARISGPTIGLWPYVARDQYIYIHVQHATRVLYHLQCYIVNWFDAIGRRDENTSQTRVAYMAEKNQLKRHAAYV